MCVCKCVHVFMCMCSCVMCSCVCVHACVCVHVCVFMCVCSCVCVHVCVFMCVCSCACVHVCVHVHVHVYVSVCMCFHVCVCKNSIKFSPEVWTGGHIHVVEGKTWFAASSMSGHRRGNPSRGRTSLTLRRFAGNSTVFSMACEDTNIYLYT